MKKLSKISLTSIFVLSLVFGAVRPTNVRAATTPSLGGAGTYAILANTFTRNIGVTTISGDLGYTTLSGGGSHTVANGTTHVADGAYSTAGTDQGSALVALAAQTCTFTFPDVNIDLATDTTHGPIGVYTPGVYCTQATRSASIGTGGITLNGTGTYIFRVDGALTSAANSIVTLAGGASACDIFWTPTSLTTLGANTTFVGTDIDNSGITVGSTSTWLGRALAFGGTVTTDVDTITAPICAAAAPGPQFGTINVVKTVINDSGGTRTVSDFPLFVNGTPVTSGVTNTFPAPAAAYFVTETGDPNYVRTFSGDCDATGGFNLTPGDNRFCIVTNNDIGAAAVVVPPLIEVLKVPSPLALPGGPGPVTYTYTLRNIGTVPVTNITMVGDTCSPIVLASGDTNGNSILDLTEVWVHRCTTTLTATHTNTVVATGSANGISTTDIASATVVVGAAVVPPLIHIVKIPSVFSLPAPGGAVTYSYNVTNPGTAPLSNVTVTDDRCTGIPGRFNPAHPGDVNQNGLLDPGETFHFTCFSNLTQTTTNTATAQGTANGLIARDFAIATVVVSTGVVAGLPNTGLAPQAAAIPWYIFLLATAFVLALLVVVVKKRKA